MTAPPIVVEELALQERVRVAAAAIGLGLPAPPSAHLVLETSGRRWDLLLGEATLVDGARGVMMAPWHGSRLAGVFFDCDEGEDYELGPPGPSGAGRLLHKRLLRFDGDALAEITTASVSWLRGADGLWRERAALPLPRLLPEGVALAQDGTAMARAGDRLDAEQRAVVAAPPSPALLVVGSAGSGKTTAALHRLAALCRADGVRFAARRLLVVLPEPALAALAATVLRELGLGEAEVTTFDEWIARQARRLLPDLPERESASVPAAVIRVKRHPALRALLPRFVAARGRELAQRLERRLAGRGAVLAAWAALTQAGANPRVALDQLERALIADAPPSLHDEITAALTGERTRLYRIRRDLLALFGDRALLGELAAASDGEVGAGAVAEVVEHTRRQLAAGSDQRFADIEAARKRTADGRHLDDGTPDEDAGSVDREDYPVALELLRWKTGAYATPRARLPRHTALVVDEAQDLAPLELRLLGQALSADAAVTVCGDRWQQIDPHARFPGWAPLMAELGRPSELRPLTQSHRCPQPVVRFAEAVLGRALAPAHGDSDGDSDSDSDSDSDGAAPGPPVLESICPSEVHAACLIRDVLVELERRAPTARVAVIARSAERARRLHVALAGRPHARLALAGDVDRAPGVQVTTVAHVKGLELDAVIVPDAEAYGDDAAARRQLYVVCTRALVQLWVVRVGPA